MTNPFEEITARLERIENLLLKKEIKKSDPVLSEPDKLLNIDQAAQLLKLTRGSIYQLIHKGKIPYSKKGRLYFSESELRKWINSGRHQTVEEIQEEAMNALYQERKGEQDHETST